jgi:excisionase family DNA binding protein
VTANANFDAVPGPRAGQPAPTPPERMLLTVEEAADALRIGRSLMYELIAAGAIETVRVGRLRRIRPVALTAFVASLGAKSDRSMSHPPTRMR